MLDEAAPPIPADAEAPNPQSIIGGGESVLPPDTRTRVTDTTAFPSSAIGLLTFDQAGGSYLCTGFLIDPNTVLTAGHCVHEGGPGGLPSTNIRFTPGRNGGAAPFGTCRGVSAQASAVWVTAQDEAEDYGWIQLDCLIGHLVGWFGYAAPGDVTGMAVNVWGYPADRPPGTQWDAEGTISQTIDPLVFYDNDTFGGMSGSPVFADVPACGGPCALAVHAYGLHGTVPPHSTLNHGTRLDATRAAEIAVAAAADDRTDTTGPAVRLNRPRDGAVYRAGAVVRASWSCTDGRRGSGIRSCVGSVPDGARLPMTRGTHTVTVTAEDGAGNVTTVTHTYRVAARPGVARVAVRPGGPVTATPTFTG